MRTMLLSHPGNCLGYRLEPAGRAICYVTDNELYPPDSDVLLGASTWTGWPISSRSADVLITDCTYTDEEYPRKVGWGHSSVSQVADLAARAGVKTLYLLHHDPDQTDAAIDAKLARVRELLAERGAATRVRAPTELEEFEIE